MATKKTTVVGPQNQNLEAVAYPTIQKTGSNKAVTAVPGQVTYSSVPGSVATPAPAAAATAAAAPINWAAVLALDPGYTAAQAAAQGNIKNALINFGAGSLDPGTLNALSAAGFNVDPGTLTAAQENPYSTIAQLQNNLNQNLHSNADTNNAHGTLFSGATAQGAENANAAHNQNLYNATQNLLSQIGVQTGNESNALTTAEGNILSNPTLYGLSTTGTVPAAATTTVAPPIVTAPIVVPAPKKQVVGGMGHVT